MRHMMFWAAIGLVAICGEVVVRTHKDTTQLRADSVQLSQRLIRIEADLDALKADVSATGIACEARRP